MTRLSAFGAFSALLVLTMLWELNCALSINGASRSAIAGFKTLAIFGSAEPGYVNALVVTAQAIMQSLFRIVACLIIGYPTGLFLASILHAIPYGPEGAQALMTPLRAIPLIGLVPLFNIWFGDAGWSLHLYLWFAIFLFVGVGALSALDRAPFVVREQAHILKLSRTRLLFTILVPTAHFGMTDVREGLASLVWAFSLAAEFLASNSGLGDFVSQAYRNNNVGQLSALLFIYASLALVTLVLLRTCEAAFQWSRGEW